MTGSERRRAPRRVPDVAEPIASLRLRAGRELATVDVSPNGALVESEGRLLPGTSVDVHVITPEGRELVRSRIVRAFVWKVCADRIVYRGALAFSRHVDVRRGYPAPGDDRCTPGAPGVDSPSHPGSESAVR